MKLTVFVLCLLLALGIRAYADHVPQSDIVPDVPRDAIPPLDNPRYDPVAETAWLADDDWVLGYERGGDARAYPIKIMNWHEIVNDTIGGLDVLVSYCPLCRSGLVFDRRLSAAEIPPQAQGALPEETILWFGNTGSLYESDMVMYDRSTNSQWFQVGGEALIGPLHGVRLKRLPASMQTWAQFRESYPQGLVLSRDTGHQAGRDYEHDIFAGYGQNHNNFYFPISKIDERLPAKSRIVGLTFGGESKAYNLSALEDGPYADQIGPQPLVLFVNRGAGAAYDPRVQGKTLSFVYQDDSFIDQQTGSGWNFSGRAISGPLQGTRLERLVQSNVYWFSWALLAPDTEVTPDLQGFAPYPVAPVADPQAAEQAPQTPAWLWWALFGGALLALGATLFLIASRPSS